jgi:hypothetical protein
MESTGVNTPPMAKTTGDEQTGSYRRMRFGVATHRLLNSDPHRKLAPEVVPTPVLESWCFAVAVTPLLDRFRLRHAMTVAIAVSLFVGLRVQRSQSVYLSNHGRGLEALAVFLKGQLKPGDSVVAALPSDLPLLYYFQKEGVAFSYLNAPTPQRKLVVVNDVSGDTVQRVLEVMRVADAGQPARLLVRCGSATLYEVFPRRSGSVPSQ